jgi:hypothetical protein
MPPKTSILPTAWNWTPSMMIRTSVNQYGLDTINDDKNSSIFVIDLPKMPTKN